WWLQQLRDVCPRRRGYTAPDKKGRPSRPPPFLVVVLVVVKDTRSSCSSVDQKLNSRPSRTSHSDRASSKSLTSPSVKDSKMYWPVTGSTEESMTCTEKNWASLTWPQSSLIRLPRL